MTKENKDSVSKNTSGTAGSSTAIAGSPVSRTHQDKPTKAGKGSNGNGNCGPNMDRWLKEKPREAPWSAETARKL
ncbi:hypothetical protein LTR37_004370 [Vermiconidia calcicola]|uniref:Uncharacterized protein n=1 Tax=Vermiconidia calcicola TaxID=1690605 RepID=A0ACC3NME7_9PEZI|nr:hypothetical protein LTR37_004370 [Vermiconidia calcicola]